jgi:hydroxypyruvate isomerase
MEGDVIATIKKYHQYISHYHTGGVPGRNEIDETQELNYGPSFVLSTIQDIKALSDRNLFQLAKTKWLP